MAKHYLPRNERPGELYRQLLIVQRREEVIDRCLAHLPSTLPLEDRQLFGIMCSAILTMPIEQCYKYEGI